MSANLQPAVAVRQQLIVGLLPDTLQLMVAKHDNLAYRAAFARRLNHWLEARGVVNNPAAWLAPRCRVSNQGAQKWIDGEAIPGPGNLKSISRALSVPVAILLGHELSNDGLTISPGGPTTPVFIFTHSEISSARDAESLFELPNKRAIVHITKTEKTPDRPFACKIEGDSMLPLYPAGYVIIFDPDAKAKNGDMVLVRLADGELTFKEYVRDAGRIFLKAINLSYPILEWKSTMRVVGVQSGVYVEGSSLRR